MATVLLIIHGLVAVALLGAITHQTLATWAPFGDQPSSFFSRFRSVQSASFATAVVVLYVVSTLLGAILYFYFEIDIEPNLNAPVTGKLLASSISRSISLPLAQQYCPPTGFAGDDRLSMSPFERALP